MSWPDCYIVTNTYVCCFHFLLVSYWRPAGELWHEVFAAADSKEELGQCSVCLGNIQVFLVPETAVSQKEDATHPQNGVRFI